MLLDGPRQFDTLLLELCDEHLEALLHLRACIAGCLLAEPDGSPPCQEGTEDRPDNGEMLDRVDVDSVGDLLNGIRRSDARHGFGDGVMLNRHAPPRSKGAFRTRSRPRLRPCSTGRECRAGTRQ